MHGSLAPPRFTRSSPWRSTQIFQPLKFRNLTLKNRVLRSNVSGRFDNYDGSGTQARINWEVKFARGGVGAIVSSFVSVHPRGRIVPNYATIDDDDRIPFWTKLGEAVHAHDCRYILQLSHSGRQRDVPGIQFATGLSSTEQVGSVARLQMRGDVAAGHRRNREGVCRRRVAGARGRARRRRAARRQRLSHHAVPQLRDQRPSRTTTAACCATARDSCSTIVRAIRDRVGPAFHLQMKISVQERNDAVAMFGLGPSGNTAEESVQVCKWLEEAGVDAIHVSTGSFFPHPRNPAGIDMPVEELEKTYDTMISSGDRAFRNYLLFRSLPEAGAAPVAGRSAEGRTRSRARCWPMRGRSRPRSRIPVICTGGFQTASVIAGAITRGDCDAVSIARPLIANNDLVEVFRRGHDRADRPCTYCNRCLVNVVENPLGCYEESRFPSRDAMVAQIMSVFNPPPFV